VIIKTYGCLACGYTMEVTLEASQWDDPEPDCPHCAARTQQEFRPFAITGSVSARAHSIAEEIITSDYHAANFQREHRQDGTPQVRYKDQAGPVTPAQWNAATGAIEQAIAVGRPMRLKHGSGLDALQENLRSGVEPDLIANSKRISAKIW
jgi:hypothetical protein